MTKSKSAKKGKQETPEATEGSEAREGRAAEASEVQHASLEPSEALQKECEDLRGKWQRAQADYQNLKRRTLSDIEAATRRAKHPLLAGVLLVLDHLEMALETQCESQEAKGVLVGVELTHGQLISFLEQEGVRPVPDGGVFDPNLHEAVASQECPDRQPGEVIETVRRGYTWGTGVLRFAQVKVAAEAVSEEAGETEVEGQAGSESDASEQD